MESSIFDEAVLWRFDVSESAKTDAIRFGRQFLTETAFRPEEVQCQAWPPDGVRVVLTHEERCLHLFFLGAGRFVFGKLSQPGRERHGEGELSLDPVHEADRLGLYTWLESDGAAPASPRS